jgi:mannose-6-phosphate isomerase-like protein (cupin superfamily)
LPTEIASPSAPKERLGELPRRGLLGGELCVHDARGNCLLEFVLPDRFPGGPNVPFKASFWAVQSGLTSPLDAHDAQEIWFVGQGGGTMFLGDELLEIRAGQAIYIPSGTPHCVKVTSTEEFTAYSVWWP